MSANPEGNDEDNSGVNPAVDRVLQRELEREQHEARVAILDADTAAFERQNHPERYAKSTRSRSGVERAVGFRRSSSP